MNFLEKKTVTVHNTTNQG